MRAFNKTLENPVQLVPAQLNPTKSCPWEDVDELGIELKAVNAA